MKQAVMSVLPQERGMGKLTIKRCLVGAKLVRGKSPPEPPGFERSSPEKHRNLQGSSGPSVSVRLLSSHNNIFCQEKTLEQILQERRNG